MKLKTNLDDAALDLWLGKAAPRYTSYPPAPFFHAGVKAQNYANSLKNIKSDEAVSIYIHIPFCRSLCLYCGCNTLITQRAERIQPYLAALQQEMKMVAGLTGRRRVNQLHFGGGTPNMLGEQDLRELFACLRKYFDLEAVREIAMELDPRVVVQGQAEILADCGVTRISLGVQDFNPEVQEIVHRCEPYEKVAEVCGWMRAAGIARVNFDLMYGLPKQTPETIADTAARVCAINPDRVALFSYAHVPQIKKHQRALEAHGLPDIHERLALDQVARGVLTGNGYHAFGVDHFARDGDPILQAWREARLHRNFQGYTEDATRILMGFGSSSISQTADGYFQNEHDERAYQSTVAAGRIPVKRGFLLSPADRARGAIIELLMCQLACDLEEVCRDHNYPLENLAEDLKRLQPYEEAGIISRRGYALCLTTSYRMAIRMVCKVFDDYSRHSQALSSRVA